MLPCDEEKCLSYLAKQKQFFRINTIKISISSFLSLSSLAEERTILPFAFSTTKKPGKTWEYVAGLIHPQSLSSMIPPLAFNWERRERWNIYDATASPGSKTTEIAALMKEKGLQGSIVANDRKERHKALLSNLSRLGVLNVVVISHDAKKPLVEDYFDGVLLDPPCTALGSWLYAWKRYKEDIARSLSRVQKAMILSAFDSLKEGGELVYSTCTFTAEENEEVISFLLQRRPNARLENISLPYDIPHDTGLSDYGREFRKTWRIYPWHLNSEGFFLAKVVKG